MPKKTPAADPKFKYSIEEVIQKANGAVARMTPEEMDAELEKIRRKVRSRAKKPN